MTTATQTTHQGLAPDGTTPATHHGEQGLCPAPECRRSWAIALALTVQQPWADAIAYSDKRCENRVWPIPPKHLGARVLIHAGKTTDRKAVLPYGQNTARMMWPDLRGLILATARLTSCHQPPAEGPLCCAPWGQTGPGIWHWRLDDVQALTRPIAVGGLQKLWRPTAGLVQAVLDQQAPTAAALAAAGGEG